MCLPSRYLKYNATLSGFNLEVPVVKYCDIITCSVRRQRLDKHISAATDTHAREEELMLPCFLGGQCEA
jgi:hypothetical protein